MASTAAAFLLQATPWIQLDIRRGSVADVPVENAEDRGPQECLVWQFVLQEFDIGLQLLQNDTIVQDSGRFKAAEAHNEDGQDNAVSMQLDTIESTVEGSFDTVDKDSNYTLRWDNSYSLVRHKTVRYRYLVTSKRAVAAAELAVQESQSRLQRRARRAAAGFPLPYLSRKLSQEREMTDEERRENHDRLTANFEQAVMDMVSIFIASPDSPLHEGAVRPFILALETVLCNGVKQELLDLWPETPYYDFLLDTRQVLRDDMGIVEEVQAGEPPLNLQYLGWNRSRAFLLLALNKGILQRAFENLTKRRMLVEKYYEPTALLYNYENARKLSSFLSALNGVKFLLSAFPDEDVEDKADFPKNMKQCDPESRLPGDGLALLNGVDGDTLLVKTFDRDPDEIKHLEDCTLPRYMLHGKDFEDVFIGRSAVERRSFSTMTMGDTLIILLQLQVQTQDIMVSFVGEGDQALTEPLTLSATDGLTELTVRLKENPVECLAVKLDNSYSVVRSKQIRIRCVCVDLHTYCSAWEGCVDMAKSITWNNASKTGGERCANYMTSQHMQEQEEVTLQRKQDADNDGQNAGGERGLRSSLLSMPVLYFVNGLLSSDEGVESCDQCLTPFSFFSRQHECPICKRVVCIPCSRHYAQVNGKGSEVKVCDGCFVKEKDNERKRLACMKDKMGDGGGECPEYTALRRDPALEKYFKMLNFGVPSSGVAQKMIQDEVPSDKVAIFAAGSDGSSAEGLARRKKRERTGSHGLKRRDSTFRKVYWTNLESTKAQETIWSRVTSRRKTAPITLSPNDFHELEDLFGNSMTTSPAKVKAKQQKAFSALDSRRSNNISIGLSRFKAEGGAEAILEALKSCDFEFLTVDRLTSLQDIAPNAVEVKRYSNFRRSRSRLELSEKFLVDMCEISRVAEKINAMLFVSQFAHQQQELHNRIQVITKACYEVLHSERLARCFELVLAIGNLLNTGTELEDAHGVTLSSLLKLSETKAIDQSLTLLQFIVKLIHDRGEGDVLLLINELGTFVEAKRFSNSICEAQARSLRHEIIKIEQEIKEDMVNDLKRFNKAEDLRRRRISEERMEHQRATSKMTSVDTSIASRSALLNAIRERNNNTNTARGEGDGTEDADNKHRVEMLPGIRTSKATVPDDHDSSRQSLLSAIRTRSNVDSADEENSIKLSDKKHLLANRRTALLAAVRQRREPCESPSTLEDAVGADAPSALLAAIQQKGQPSSSSTDLGGTARTAMLAAIRERSKPKSTDVGLSHQEKIVPRQYKTESKFISVMRGRLLEVKVAFEDIEMEMETMQSVWEGTARYLAEDPVGSSSEYVFGLLYRFLLDIKVAKTLLFRKGLSFASEANALLPHAPVGSTVATKLGPGVITALRIADKRIEVKFPWSREAYLAPSSILSVGSLVRCRLWGVGIIRKTCYDVGFCDVRFSFGYGNVRVEDLTPETSSNNEQLRLDILATGFRIRDPVVTPFGCGHVQSIRGKPQSPSAVLSVGLLDSETDIHGEERSCMAVAFVSASRVKRNY